MKGMAPAKLMPSTAPARIESKGAGLKRANQAARRARAARRCWRSQRR
jgi:hypothetical protein